jgi:predicted transcriptional regulator
MSVWEVRDVLRQLGGQATARQITEALNARHPRAANDVSTDLTRLHRLGVVQKREGPRNPRGSRPVIWSFAPGEGS